MNWPSLDQTEFITSLNDAVKAIGSPPFNFMIYAWDLLPTSLENKIERPSGLHEGDEIEYLPEVSAL